MLKKLTEIDVPPTAPFTNDALEREEPIKRLTRLVESTEQPFVLSVEAPWGWGKTTFIRMWKAHLESNGHICLHFNAWESDSVDDPLVACLGEMRRFVEQEMKDIKSDAPITAHWDEVKRIGAGVLRKALPVAVQVATHGLRARRLSSRLPAHLLMERAIWPGSLQRLPKKKSKNTKRSGMEFRHSAQT